MTKLSDETGGGKKNGRTGRWETGATEDLDALTHERESQGSVPKEGKKGNMYIHI